MTLADAPWVVLGVWALLCLVDLSIEAVRRWLARRELARMERELELLQEPRGYGDPFLGAPFAAELRALRIEQLEFLVSDARRRLSSG